MAGHDRLTSDGQKFFRAISDLKKLSVRVGYQSGRKAEKDGTDICHIAALNELGTDDMPSRPFLAQSVDNHSREVDALCKKAIRKISTGGTAEEVLSMVGAGHTGIIQAEIRDGSFVPNAPSTIRRKKSDHPLIDTGTMRQSVHFVIEPKGGE